MLTFALAVFSACVVTSLACSCFPEHGPDQFCRYSVAIRGMIKAEWEERREPLDHSDPFAEFYQDSEWVYTVEVEQFIMAPEEMKNNKTIRIRTPTQDNLCGTRFPVDVSHILFGWQNQDGSVETGLCAPNTMWDSLDEWHRELITEHIPDYCANKDESAESEKPPEP